MLLSSIVAMPFLAAILLLFVADRHRLAVRLIALLGAGYSLVASCLAARRACATRSTSSTCARRSAAF